MQIQIDPQSIDIDAAKQAAQKWGWFAFLAAGFAILWHMADAWKERTWRERLAVLFVRQPGRVE